MVGAEAQILGRGSTDRLSSRVVLVMATTVCLIHSVFEVVLQKTRI